MYIQALTLEGLAPFGSCALRDLDRVVALRGPEPALDALLTGVEFFFSAFSEARLGQLLYRLAIAGHPGGPTAPEIVRDGLELQATWEATPAVAPLLAVPTERTLHLELVMALDPVQFRDLREEAARDPRLLRAIAEGSHLTIQVGVLFARSLDALSTSPLSLRIGDHPISLAPGERPAWVEGFCRRLAPRYASVPHLWGDSRHGDEPRSWSNLPPPGDPGLEPGPDRSLAAAWEQALLSPDAERQQAWQALVRDLRAAPFDLESPRVVRWTGGHPRVVAGARMAPVDRMGPTAREGLAIAGAVHLSGAEILGLYHPGRGWKDPNALWRWLAAQAEDEPSPLEQVLLLGVDSPEARDLSPQVQSHPPPPPPAATFP